ncbi:hypothetical protein GCM10022243_39680 [Saccharothrix violaceirubra]|uniref:AraC-like DNA-binding protein n=1 Tax=Saccharothrix violaceirubra TaxID=413306 RepID=A0A7W7WUH4_9PSEU|nr:helix-turn-helix domain-containing protein [Saccharothrix violaceirubra]MBB4964249.1 AraC-like DNA-binding protein [Saccharothrix violaceirubra]
MDAPRRLPVPAELLHWVDGIDLESYRSGPLVHLPDAATTLVWRTLADGAGALFVMGPRTRAAYYDAKDVPVCVRFRFAPGAARVLLGMPVDGFADRVVPFDGLRGTATARPGAVLDRMAAALADRVRAARLRDRATAELVRRASIGLARKDGDFRIGDVARRLGVGERHLRDAFTTTVGIPPKRFVRLARLRAVLSGLRREPRALLAGESGYYDQSHMTAHFREVMRVTPTDFLAGRLPVVSC